MKIRIKGNSVRFRLTQSEVKQLCEKRNVEEQTNFGANQFTYCVRMENEGGPIRAEFKNDTITLFLPNALGKDWFENEKVGFEHYQNDLYLLVEKDFTCLDNTLEDQSDNYPNPKLLTNE